MKATDEKRVVKSTFRTANNPTAIHPSGQTLFHYSTNETGIKNELGDRRVRAIKINKLAQKRGTLRPKTLRRGLQLIFLGQ